jgi:TonB family protein
MHSMHLLRRLFALWIGVAWVCAPSASLCARTPQNMDELAGHIARMADLPRPQKVLVAPLDGCLLEEEVCTAQETAVKASIEKMAPAVRFAEREEVLEAVKKLGFMGLDAYNSGVLGQTASEIGADIFVTETLQWVPDGYELTSEVLDIHKDESLIKLELKAPRSTPDVEDDPVVLKDRHSGISLVIMKGKKSGFPLFRQVTCERCPHPMYTEEARKKGVRGTAVLLATVTDQAAAQNIRVAKSLDPGLGGAAMESVRSWRPNPAVGSDGKPFSARVPIAITFRWCCGAPHRYARVLVCCSRRRQFRPRAGPFATLAHS